MNNQDKAMKKKFASGGKIARNAIGAWIYAVIALVTGTSAWADAYSDSVGANNPLIYFKFGETSGTSAANSGTLSGSGTAVSGVLAGAAGPNAPTYSGFSSGNTAASFGGSSNIHVDGTSTLGVNLGGSLNGATGATVELWFNASAVNSNVALLQLGVPSSMFDIELLNNTIKVGGRSVSSDAFQTFTYAAGLSASTWYQLDAVFDYSAKTLSLYLNGVAVQSQSVSWGSSTLSYTASASELFLGQFTSSTGGFSGSLDNVALYNTALSASNIAAHYAAAVPEPSSFASLGFGLAILVAAGWRARRQGACDPA